MKVVINKCYGGFGLSDKAKARYAELGGTSFSRDCPVLVRVVEELGVEANDWCSKLAVVEIPDGTDWEIEEYDGKEWISESHRTWG